MEYNKSVWKVEYTDNFGEWWETLSEAKQKRVVFLVCLLKQFSPSLQFSHCTDVK
jgi:hypothetical protein